MKLTTTILAFMFTLVSGFAGGTWEVGVSYPEMLLPAKNIRINSVDSISGVPSVTFKVTSQLTEAVSVSKVGVYVDSTAQGPSTISVYDGTTLLGTRALPANSAGNVFSVNITFSLAASTEKILTVKADYPSNFSFGTKVTLMVSGVEYVKSDMTVNTVSSDIWGPEMHFYPVIADFVVASAPQGSKTALTVGSATTGSITGTFTLHLTALGGNISQLAVSDVQVVAVPISNQANAYVCPSAAVSQIPNGPTADGSTSSVTIVGAIPASMLPSSGGYRLMVSRITWSSNTGQQVTQVWGLNDMITPTVVAIKSGTKFGTVSTSMNDTTLSLVADVVNDEFTVQAKGDLGVGQWVNLPVTSYQVFAISKDQATNGMRMQVDVPLSYLVDVLGTSDKAFIRVSQ